MESSTTREASVKRTMRGVHRNARPSRMRIPRSARNAAAAGGEIAESQIAGRAQNLFTRPGIYMRGAVLVGSSLTGAGAAILTNPSEAAAATLDQQTKMQGLRAVRAAKRPATSVCCRRKSRNTDERRNRR